MANKVILEACVDNFIDTQRAAYLKAKRVEVCSRLDLGGLSPELELVEILLRRKINTLVMLRTNDTFEVNEEELKEILAQIKMYRKAGVSEYIFGFIKDGQIDVDACKKVISKLGKKDKWVFHRAIDQVGNYEENLKLLAELGFSRVLTSGGKHGSAMDNLDSLAQIVKLAGNKIKVVVGGGVNKDNYEEIMAATDAKEFHGTKILW